MANKLIKQVTHTMPSGTVQRADVRWNEEYEEFIVQFFRDGQHQRKADYHTDNKKDAIGTAEYWVTH